MFNKYIFSAIGILALVAAIIFGVTQCKRVDQNNQNQQVNSGIAIERGKSNEETVNALEAVRRAPTGNELNSVCGKYDRNCEKRP